MSVCSKANGWVRIRGQLRCGFLPRVLHMYNMLPPLKLVKDAASCAAAPFASHCAIFFPCMQTAACQAYPS